MKRNKPSKATNFRRLRFGTASTVLTIAVIVAVLLLNILVSGLADRYPLTWDLSTDKVFTLSDESVRIAESVKNEVEIIIFSDEEEFTNPSVGASVGMPEIDTTMREFHTVLQQYRSRTDNKVTFQFINPNQDPTAYSKYEQYEVTSGSILFLSGERYKTASIDDLYDYSLDEDAYLMGQISYIFNASKVEKVLGSNINALQTENNRIVQVLVGHEEDQDTITGLQTLYELNGYTFEEFNITGSAEFNEDAEVMLIPAPAKDYSDSEIKRVREWVTNNQKYGRHLIVFTDYTASCPNLYGMLDADYGIQVTNELLYETDANRQQDYNHYFPVCDVPSTNYTTNSAGTGNVFTPLARRITTSLPSEHEQEDTIGDLGIPLTNYPESTQVISLKDFADQDTVSNAQALDESLYPLTSMVATILDRYDNNTGTAAYGTVVVSGCPFMAYTDYVQNSTLKNEELLLDVINSVTGHENSVTISNKEFSDEAVYFDANVQLGVGLGVFTIGIPVLVLVICLVVFLRRKNL